MKAKREMRRKEKRIPETVNANLAKKIMSNGLNEISVIVELKIEPLSIFFWNF